MADNAVALRGKFPRMGSLRDVPFLRSFESCKGEGPFRLACRPFLRVGKEPMQKKQTLNFLSAIEIA